MPSLSCHRRAVSPVTFSAGAELQSHKSTRAFRFEITFGFEAVAHALYNCDRISIYGFFLDEGSDDIWKDKSGGRAAGDGGRGSGGGSGKAASVSGSGRFAPLPGATSDAGSEMETPYHYYENRSYDKSATDPTKPWTYKYHNFELEHRKYRQLERACWLNVVNK